MTEKKIIQKYITLIQRYTEQDASATEFSLEYLQEFKNEQPGLSEGTYEILQSMFAEAEAYCEDPELRGEWDIGEEELIQAARETVTKLEQRLKDIDS
ncbi:hypothetical protein G3I44_14750 [Halogeometricum borinquense]|uniref:Colicin D immunity protein domain-containing protein n=1 Tax=Halogeometricum borinquense TaxID=60847 RepID=A0A6C0UJ31_9EURY|nr:colicin immunity domain-containing protein [Halogeometricum borinquense]QIB75445.1 hypothetical protein G3I44_14750 [Halogeometricum borinquense]